MQILLEHERVVLFGGDSANLDLPENSVDAIVCDPPAAISFMGKGWDDDRGGYDGWTRWLAGVLAPSVRALRPGGHALLWALPRTSHWTARAVEMTGLEIRDVHHDLVAAEDAWAELAEALTPAQRELVARALETIGAPIVYHAFGSGFPKSLNIQKEMEARGVPSSERWSGLGTALKPAVEHWILARKPLVGTYADNVMAHGTGALNIDACRIGTSGETFRAPQSDPRNRITGIAVGEGLQKYGDVDKMQAAQRASIERTASLGRWPAHLSLRHAPGCVVTGTATEDVPVYENAGADPDRRDGNPTNMAMGAQRPGATHEITRDVYACVGGCPVAELDAQSGTTTGSNGGDILPGQGDVGYKGGGRRRGQKVARSKGGASRFFYVAKASRREKDAGLDHLPRRSGGDATDREDGSAGLASPRAGAGRTGGARNHHPTGKAVALMEWLIKLVVPSAEALGRPGIVLDPFAGSGTTGVAALGLGCDFIGCEQGGDGGEYWPILVGRIQHALRGR